MNESDEDAKRRTTRLNWKLTDVWGQIGTIILPWLWYVFLSEYMPNEDREAIMFKSMVAANIGWVLISMIVHIRVWRAPWIVLGRKIFVFIYLAILITELLYLVFIAPNRIIGRNGDSTDVVIMLSLMACVPIMGIPYFFISIHEMERLKSRKYIREHRDR